MVVKQIMKTSIQSLFDSLPKSIVAHIQHLERMRQDFVANVSHELRTPLTVVHGYLETLLEQEELNKEALKTIFLQMQQQTNRMVNLVENLLLLSRLEHDDLNGQIQQPIPIANLLSLICTEAKQLSNKEDHQIHLEADPALKLMGVEDELRSLFSNIIFNAVKYTPARGEIYVRWYQLKNKAYFTVCDSGIGIAAKHIPRLTERFYRVDKARSRASGGTGLGLAIAKHVLIRHDGKLNIKSQVGKGSAFSCVFPKSRMCF